MAPWKRRSTIVVIPKNTRRRISKQRQIKKEKKESTRLEQFIGEDGSTRLEKSIEEEGSTRLEKSTEEKYEETSGADASSTNIDASNDKFKSNENAQGENRGFEDEQRTKYRHDTPILEEDTSHAVESFPASPSPDTSLIKPIRYLDYSFETLIERYPSLMGSVNVKSGLGKSCKEKELIEYIKSKDVRKSVKKSLCLLYFVHNFLCAKNLNTKLPSEWILQSAYRDAFSAYPWGRIVHPWISPTPSEMEMNFLTRLVPLQLTKDDKIEKLERDLNGVGTIKRDCTVVEGDLDPSRAVYVGGTVVGESSSPNIDRGKSGVGVGGGGGSYLFVTSGLGDFSGDFRVGRSPIIENVSRPRETPSTIEVLSCKLCHEKIDLLTARVDVLEKAITTMMSKKGICPS
ncbi:hypothetical protein FXO38_03952 [Capsicum annuum]|nr:hypothetical protein FXO38_03952 [Capsicum annuum]